MLITSASIIVLVTFCLFCFKWIINQENQPLEKSMFFADQENKHHRPSKTTRNDQTNRTSEASKFGFYQESAAAIGTLKAQGRVKAFSLTKMRIFVDCSKQFTNPSLVY